MGSEFSGFEIELFASKRSGIEQGGWKNGAAHNRRKEIKVVVHEVAQNFPPVVSRYGEQLATTALPSSEK